VDATIEFDRRDGGAFQITAGMSDVDGSAHRQLVFGVPGTNDEVGLDWSGAADFSGDDPVPVSLRVGTMSPGRAVLKRGELVATEPAHEPPFGPNAEGILRAVAEALETVALAHPDTLAGLWGRLSTLLATNTPAILSGKVPEFSHGKVPQTAHGKVPQTAHGKVSQTADGEAFDAGAGAAAPGHLTEVTMHLYGKAPKYLAYDGAGGDLAGTVAQYAAAGVALGTMAGGPAGGAQGGLLGALVGVTVYLAG
jgi:hypothetical protein